MAAASTYGRRTSKPTRPPRSCPTRGVAVVPIVAIHGAQVPWGKVVSDGVPVVAARRLPSMLRALPAVLEPERVAWLDPPRSARR
jgi:hypothetical protein